MTHRLIDVGIFLASLIAFFFWIALCLEFPNAMVSIGMGLMFGGAIAAVILFIVFGGIIAAIGLVAILLGLVFMLGGIFGDERMLW
jgi:hypothetical protein